MILILFSFLMFAGHTTPLEPTVLLLGESTNLPAQPNLPVFVQNKGVIRLKDQGHKLRITGKKRGRTKMSIGSQSYSIVVLGKKNYQTWKTLKQWVQNRRGLKIKIMNNEVILEGQFLTSSDFMDLSLLKDMNFKNRAHFSPRTIDSSRKILERILSQANLKASHISLQPSLQVSLSKDQKVKLNEFKKRLAPFGASISIQNSSLSIKPVIKIKVLIAQVKKSFFRHWGVEWPGSVEAQVIGQSLSPFSLPLTAHTLEKQGWGKVLASPTLVAQSGKKARFHSGGEFPIRSSNQFSQQVLWKKYGIMLEIRPQADLNKHLRIDIKNEISMIDSSQVVEGFPSLIKDEFQSVFNLKHPKPIVISGLFKKEWGESRKGLPLLSQIPIFRHLFSDEAELDSETELVFIVSPEIVEL